MCPGGLKSTLASTRIGTLDIEMNLSERFAAAHGKAVEVRGRMAVQMARIPCRNGDAFRIRLSNPLGRLGQGVSLSLREGHMTVNDRDSRDVVLWTQTAPESVDVVVNSLTNGTDELLVWNCWRGPQDQTMAWLGNAGMVVTDQNDKRWVLECSDGSGEPNFDDLIVEIARVPP